MTARLLKFASSSVKTWTNPNYVSNTLKEKAKTIAESKGSSIYGGDEVTFTSHEAERILAKFKEEAFLRMIKTPKTTDNKNKDLVVMSSSNFSTISYEPEPEPDELYDR